MNYTVLLFGSLLIAGPCLAHPFGEPLPDSALATMRGGIRLPDGTDVAIGVAIETQINGVVALRTQFSTLQPGVQVYAGGRPAVAVTSVSASTSSAPILDFDRNAAGTTVTVAPATVAVALNVGGGGSLPPVTGAPLPVQPDGTSAATPLGSVALHTTSGGFSSELAGNGFDIQQMVGQFTGAVVRNTVDNQSISTSTWVSINLQGVATPSNLASTLSAAARAIVVH